MCCVCMCLSWALGAELLGCSDPFSALSICAGISVLFVYLWMYACAYVFMWILMCEHVAACS